MVLMVENELNTKAIIWAYKLFLDRKPENDSVVKDLAARRLSTSELRKVFWVSEEFKLKNPEASFLPLSGKEPRMEIDDSSDINEIFPHIQNAWKCLGESEPHWSVVTQDK
jgi:hypothetical protein